MKFFGNIDLQKNLLQQAALEMETVLPVNPTTGQLVFSNNVVYICTEIINEIPMWLPLTNTITSFIHDQTESAPIWIINHDLNSEAVVVQIYDQNKMLVTPDQIDVVSPSTIQIDFGTTFIGTAVIISGSSGVAGSSGSAALQTLTSLGIPNVENKSSATIRSEITNSDVTTSLGFTPASLGANVFTEAQTFSDQNVSRINLIDFGVVFLDKGESGTTAQVVNFPDGSHQKITVTGAHTISISNWPATDIRGELLIELVNGAAFAITWPTINWVKSDGTFTTTFSENGVTLQTTGTDFVLLWTRDAGTTIYGKIVR